MKRAYQILSPKGMAISEQHVSPIKIKTRHIKKPINCASLVLLVSFLFLFVPMKAQIDYGIKAKINILETDGNLSFNAQVKSNSNNKINGLIYKLILVKESTDNNYSKVQQSNTFTIAPNEQLLLAKQTLNTNAKTSVSIYLYIFKNNEIIATDSIDYNTFSKQENSRKKEPLNSEFTCAIVNNTFSQRGNDFCEFFTQVNQQKKATYPFVVEIKEKNRKGTNLVEIFILVEDQVVYKFKTLENPTYLFAAAQESNKRLAEYCFNESTSLR